MDAKTQTQEDSKIKIKITFIHGMSKIVSDEISSVDILREKIHAIDRTDDSLFFTFTALNKEVVNALASLKSIVNVYLVQHGEKLHPLHIHNHKSILGDVISIVLSLNSTFRTFKLRCAGSDSPEVVAIQKYIAETFKLAPAEDADLDMYIHKPDALWEVGVRLFPRPISVRDYKVEHIKGGINPTVAYAMNTFALKGFDTTRHDSGSNQFSYLNICSGSATLLTEAGIILGKNIKSAKLLGFDIDKKANSQAIRNITKAGLIKDIQIKTADILDNPDFGMFDAIVSDLPFGMQIGKDEDLAKLYKAFMEYCSVKLKANGVLVVYTTEADTFKAVADNSLFNIDETIPLKIGTAVGSYIQPKIFVCTKK